jgi:hypothetical protein
MRRANNGLMMASGIFMGSRRNGILRCGCIINREAAHTKEHLGKPFEK